jgi:hypothetical protein
MRMMCPPEGGCTGGRPTATAVEGAGVTCLAVCGRGGDGGLGSGVMGLSDDMARGL